MADFKPMAEEPLWAVRVMYEVYKGKAPLKLKPTGKYDFRPPFFIREREIKLHVVDSYMQKRIAALNYGDGEVSDKAGNVYYRAK